ncbi:trypsin-like peptidase domain-containing protein [Streptomyces roseicoloratus]|uniref:Trypsin-like peptidase domain-containing protein n=1 Tax=Streptomyces roseicoloratus TaxID=2508722 RepID=A0ABY9RWY4_9ACTN|nr:trypsin-like peptidase domain-containing protein [Streptomyces roseicoloratus]WMX46021.1 trypsin-like peptidase domain-containing protein [Streptomyces roseicoloratus]
MSTENEGAAVPADQGAPSTPPTPPATPATPPAPAAPPSAPPAQPPATTQEPIPAEPAAATQQPTPAPTSAPTPAPASPPASEQPTAIQAPLTETTAPLPPTPQPTPAQAQTAAQTPAHAHAHAHSPAPAAGGWPPAPPATPAWGAPAAPVPEAPRKRGGGLVAAVLVAALVAGGVGGGIGYWAASQRDDSAASTTVSSGDAPSSFKRDPGTVAAIAAKALPSVVTIQAKSGGVEGEGGTGTGFVYDKEGHIVTNNHVVASAAEGGTLSATFSNGKTYDAEVVGRAEGYDVAVLKLKNAPGNLTPLPLGDSDKVAVGDSTIAIGAPFGLSNTVTTGIISAKNRPVASGDGAGGKNSYMSALQTDASINPGNSGGPLLDASGAVIGINSAIQSTGSGFGQSQAGSIGLGFAIPVNQAKNVAEQLIKTGKPVYPVIGAVVNMQDRGEGATIAEQGTGGTPSITPNGPAAKAGLKPGDVITGFGDHQIDSGPTLISEIWTHQPGDSVKITYERAGKPATTTVTLGERTGDN